METYISLLPGDLRNELKTIEIYQTPYPEVLEICGKLCDDPNFWLRKAATETQEVYKNPEFTKFFNDYPGHIDIEKYIRVLAYDGKVVPDATIKGRYYPGSDILVGLPEIFRHGLKDPVILEYAFRILKTIIIDSNLYEEIVSLLITSRNIELLIKFFQEAIFSNHLNGGGPLYVPLLYLGYPKKDIEKLLHVIKKINVQKNIKDRIFLVPLQKLLKNYTDFEQFMQENEKELHDDVVNNKIHIEPAQIVYAIVTDNPKLSKLQNIAGKVFNSGHLNTLLVMGYIIKEDIDSIARMESIEIWYLVMKFLALSDSIEMFKLIYSKLIADDQNYFLERILIYSNYNSKLFAYVLNNYPLTIQRGEYRTRELIKYKSYMDFAGLATICQNPDFILTENSYYGNAKTIEDILRTTKNM